MLEGEIKYIRATKLDRRIKTNYSEVESTLYNFLKIKCQENGSTLQGRIANFVSITGARQKPCIHIDDHTLLIPSKSLRNDEVLMVNYWLINRIKKLDENNTMVYFKDNSTFKMDCNIRTINLQMSRCAHYISRMI